MIILVFATRWQTLLTSAHTCQVQGHLNTAGEGGGIKMSHLL